MCFLSVSICGFVDAKPDGAGNPFSEERTLFIQAQLALRDGKLSEYESIIEEIKNYPLLDYLHRDRLISNLSRTPDSEKIANDIRRFLRNHADQVVNRKLRYHWLNHLAKSNRAIPFLQDYQESSSIRLKCHYLRFRMAKEPLSIDLNAEIETVWLNPKSLPKSCDKLIQTWKDSGALSQTLIWKRMLLAANQKQYSLVDYLSRLQTDNMQSSGRYLRKLIRNPKHLFKKKVPLFLDSQKQTVTYMALEKLAWQDPTRTIKTWKKYSHLLSLNPEQIINLKRSIGLNLAINQSIEARDWLKTLDPELDASVDQWLLSSALSHQDWKLIDHITRQKTNQSIEVDKWRYWRAISTKHNGFPSTSDWLLKSLAKKRSYYGFLAAINQKLKPQLNIQSNSVGKQRLEKISELSEAIRAREFFFLGQLSNARKEWNGLISKTPQADYVVLAELAYQWGWNHQSILAFARSKQIDDVNKRFPLYQIEQYKTESKRHKIPVSWAYAITRQESAFKEDASSGKGAKGLMQLTPSTARQVAKRQAKTNKIKYRKTNQLIDPEINIKLGIAHLKEMLDHYNGHPILATAAYNAGRHRVDSWLRDNQIADSILWIEQIPYKETREYVKNVLTYQQIYAQLSNSSDSFIANISQMSIPTKNNSSFQLTAH